MDNKYYLLNKHIYANKEANKSHDEIIEEEYLRRMKSPSRVLIDFDIKAFSRIKQTRLTDKSYPLYYVLLPEHLWLIKTIVARSKEIMRLVDPLPGLARERIGLSQLVTEIQSSNDIEGVRSTRQEIETAVNLMHSSKKVRFKSAVERYNAVLNSEKPKVEDLQTIRNLYDKTIIEEIDEDSYPDGKLFRKNRVWISDVLRGDFVHAGDNDEEEISSDLLKLIKYMNLDTESDLIKSIISHYIFEYIHPFYDGNGRFGRYLLSSYLSYKLDPFSALSISEAIKQNKEKYQKAFTEVSNPLNRGELTFFIKDLLEIIIKGQENVSVSLLDANRKMQITVDFIEELDFSSIEKNLLFLMIQSLLFVFGERYMTNIELFELLKDKYSRTKVDNAMKSLEKKEFVYKISKNPLAYSLNLDKLPDFD